MSHDDRTDGAEVWNVVEDDGVLDASDTLDDDRVPDPLDTGVAAADRWAGANRFGTTPAEERAGESLEQLLAEEEPDVDPFAEAADDEDELTRRRCVAGSTGVLNLCRSAVRSLWRVRRTPRPAA
jgi:hypothetical protein